MKVRGSEGLMKKQVKGHCFSSLLPPRPNSVTSNSKQFPYHYVKGPLYNANRHGFVVVSIVLFF